MILHYYSVTLRVVCLSVPDGLGLTFRSCWDFYAQQALKFTPKREKKQNKKNIVRGSSRWGQKTTVWVVWADRKARVPQITTLYNQGKEKSISEPATGQSLWWTGNNSRKPHQVPFLSAQNRNLRLLWTHTWSPKHFFIHSWCLTGTLTGSVSAWFYASHCGRLISRHGWKQIC